MFLESKISTYKTGVLETSQKIWSAGNCVGELTQTANLSDAGRDSQSSRLGGLRTMKNVAAASQLSGGERMVGWIPV